MTKNELNQAVEVLNDRYCAAYELCSALREVIEALTEAQDKIERIQALCDEAQNDAISGFPYVQVRWLEEILDEV